MAETSTVFDWRRHARARGLTDVQAWLYVRNRWPTESATIGWLQPVNTRRLDALAAKPEHVELIRQLIDDAPTPEPTDG